MDVAGKDCPVGAVLHFDPIGRNVYGRVAVMTLQGGSWLLLAHLTDGSAPDEPGRDQSNCKDGAKGAHGPHLTAPCTIFKRAPPSSTTVRVPRSAFSCPAWNWPRLTWPATGPALCSLRGLMSGVRRRVTIR